MVHSDAWRYSWKDLELQRKKWKQEWYMIHSDGIKTIWNFYVKTCGCSPLTLIGLFIAYLDISFVWLSRKNCRPGLHVATPLTVKIGGIFQGWYVLGYSYRRTFQNRKSACICYVIAGNIVTNACNQNKMPVISGTMLEKWQAWNIDLSSWHLFWHSPISTPFCLYHIIL